MIEMIRDTKVTLKSNPGFVEPGAQLEIVPRVCGCRGLTNAVKFVDESLPEEGIVIPHVERTDLVVVRYDVGTQIRRGEFHVFCRQHSALGRAKGQVDG